ncbi:IclR family transcriptional regulator [Planosporangium flavigriseum]|uniref:IclR family transcriptional regulator n=1 Tax=Planosporangium flavigriseum TaxID=373681 RepID=A0A8J3LMN1_9ACTN|nr:IclR family transcriptional regulator [Planosporangium flavigriseum]NJC63119.1 IclR family transcriptional regulator [Planosporangium flavigriseum]GIG74497.1 IclR family transcriptional regulator [Planosporangium flavigriseum]
MSPPEARVVQSALKVLKALEYLCRAPQAVSLEQLAQELSVTAPTAYRVVNTLIETGYARTNGFHNGYVATLKVMELGSHVYGSFDLRDAARAAFRPVGMRFGETITIAKSEGSEAVFIEKMRAGASLVFYCDVGRRLPVHIGAAGRCIMAHLDDEEFENYLEGELIARTPETHTSPDVLRALRAQTVEDGYVLSVDEVDIGVSAIAVPLLASGGRLLGAAAIANTSTAWTAQDRADRVAAMKMAAASMVTAVPDREGAR